MRLPLFLLIIIFLGFLSAGCSSRAINPIEPGANPAPSIDIPVSELGISTAGHDLIGMWNVNFDIETLTATIIPDRTISSHFYVTGLIGQPVISVRAYDPMTGIMDVDVTLNNPSTLDGFDVRLIVYNDDNGIRLKNPDAWTSLWDTPGGSQINPFRAYAKTKPGRIFNANTSNKERLQIFLPTGSPMVRWAVDASWPSNCPEPYATRNFMQRNRLRDVVGSAATIEVDVLDWQNDVDTVSLFCPALTGQTLVPFSFVNDSKWRLNLVNITGASAGEYTAFVVATSAGSAGLALYNWVKITVSENVISDWTLFYYVLEANLYSVRNNFNEMEVVGSREGDMNVIVLWDKTDTVNDVILEIQKDPGGYNDTIISPSIDDHGEVIPPEGLDLNDPETLTKFLRWGMREYPAQKYGFFMMSHGNGGVYSFPPEKSFLLDMGVWEFNNAAKIALDENPNVDRLEFVGLECCTMAFIDTAYALRECCKVAWSAEYLMYVYSAQYDVVLAELLNNLDYDGYQFAELYVGNTLASGGALTYGAWDSDLTASLVIPAMDTFSLELINALPEHRDAIVACRTAADDWGSECLDFRVSELGYFAEQIINYDPPLPQALTDAAVNLRNAIDTAVFYLGVNQTGTGCYYSSTGWQVLFTDRFNDPSMEYQEVRDIIQNTGIGVATHWDEFLTAYDINDY